MMPSAFALANTGAFHTSSPKVFRRPSHGGYASDPSTALLYKFEETSGNKVIDSSPHGSDGTIQGATRVVGYYGKGLEFDGINDRVVVPDAAVLQFTAALTLEAWIKPGCTGFGIGTILSKRNSYTLRLVETPAIRAGGSIWRAGVETQLVSVRTLQLGAWHHVALTFDGTNLKLYVDGAVDQVLTLSPGSVDTATQPLYLGTRMNGTGTNWFCGTMDEVRLSNTVRRAWELDPNVV